MGSLFENPNLVFKLQLFCCFYLMGLIWTIQAVHYPAYHYIDLTKFQDYQDFHTKWITPIVAPIMILELFTAGILVLQAEKPINFWILNLIGVILIWAVTFGLSVPAHNVLMKAYDFKAAQFLILTNWLRTALWTIRSVALFAYWVIYK